MYNLRSYLISYIINEGSKEILKINILILISFIVLIQYLFMTIGVKIDNKIGTRFITLIGVILINLSLLLMMISANYALIFISLCIFELGYGLSNLSVIKNCWEYYPNRLGLIYGIIICGFRLSSSILTYIADLLIINPEKRLPDFSYIYPKEVTDKFLNYIKFLAILVFILSIIAVCLTFNYQIEDSSKIEKLNEESKCTNNNSNALSRYFCSKKNFFLSLFCFFGPCI